MGTLSGKADFKMYIGEVCLGCRMEDCEGGACAVGQSGVLPGSAAGKIPPVEGPAPGGGAGPAVRVVVYSRAICGLCWICRWHFWSAGLDYEVRDVDTDQSWGAAIDRNGYTGGTFKLPVVVHGEKAWWDIKVRNCWQKIVEKRLGARGGSGQRRA